MAGALAAGLGYLARFLLTLGRAALGASGPGMVIYGVSLIYVPAGWIVAGIFVLLLLGLDLPTSNKPSEDRE
jgi:hypothetical protein